MTQAACHLSFSLLSVFLVIHYRPIVEELADIILSADIETVRAIQHRYGEQVTFDVASPACVHCLCQISYSQPPTSLEVCLAKADANEQSDDSSELEISLKVVDINDEDERRRYEGEQAQARSASLSSLQRKSDRRDVKPVALYVSNWTDDEKYKRSKNPRRLADAQLVDRYRCSEDYLHSLRLTLH